MHFDRAIDVVDEIIPNSKYRVYEAGNWGDVHKPLIVFFHGAGHSALVWSLLTKMIKQSMRVAAWDLRGHGHSLEVPEPHDLSIKRLVSDGLKMLQYSVQHAPESSNQLVVCGHSAGGSIAARVAESAPRELGIQVSSVVLLDVVEGLSIQCLPQMESFAAAIQPEFCSQEEAIEWSLHHLLTSKESAKISIPDQLFLCKETGTYKWTVDLKTTKEFWHEWFQGLTDAFLACKSSKILVLAGGTHHDRLDKDMTIAQMQGRFQLELIAKSGHIVQEDQPGQVAGILLTLARRICSLNGINSIKRLSSTSSSEHLSSSEHNNTDI